MRVVASVEDRKNFNSLLNILVILAIKLQGGKIKPLKETIGDTSKPGALAFIKKYGANGKLFAGLYLNILKKSDDVLPFAEPFVQDLRKVINSNRLKHDLDSMSSDSKQVLEPVLTLLSNPDSQNALSNLNRRIGLLKQPELTKKFTQIYSENARQEVIDVPTTTPILKTGKAAIKPDKTAPTPSNTVDKVAAQIDTIVQQITGKKGAAGLTAQDKENAQATPEGKELLRKLTVLRKQLSDYRLAEFRNIVSQSSDNIMSAPDLTAALIKRGIKRLTIPPAFQTADNIYMNIDGQWCDSEGRVAIRQGWQADAEIIANPSYSHDTPKKNWLYLVKTGATKNYVYTQGKVAEKRSTNFAKVGDTLAQDIKQVKAKWRNNMLGKPDDEKTVYANLAEFIYQTTSRVGSGIGMTKGTSTYGAANFLVKHVNLKSATDSRLMIKYHIAKSSKEETFILSAKASDLGSNDDVRWSKALIKFIRGKCAGKKPDDVVFSLANGNPVNTTRFNSYLSSIDLPFTAKTFRTMRGTELAIDALNQAEVEFKRLQKASKKPLPSTAVNSLFKMALTHVGELLGHIRRNKEGGEEATANTAIKSYVDPRVMLNFFRNIGYAPPSTVIQSAKAAGIEV